MLAKIFCLSRRRQSLWLFVACACTGLLAACAGYVPANNAMIERDMLEIRSRLNEYLEKQDTTQRKLEYWFSATEEGFKGRNDTLIAAIGDLEKRTRDLLNENEQLRGRIEELGVKIDRLDRRQSPGEAWGGGELNWKPPEAGPQPGAPDNATSGLTTADQAYLNALRFFNAGKYQEAREGFRQALEQKPEQSKKIEILYWLAESCSKLKDNTAAYNNYYELMQTDPRHPRAWASLERMADIYIERGDTEQAIRMLRQIEQVNPDYPEIDRVRATIQKIAPTMAPAPTGELPSLDAPPTTTETTQTTTTSAMDQLEFTQPVQ